MATEIIDQFDKAEKRLNALKKAAGRTQLSPDAFATEINAINKALFTLKQKAEGSSAREEVGERNPPSVRTHLRAAYRGLSTTYGQQGCIERVSLLQSNCWNLMKRN